MLRRILAVLVAVPLLAVAASAQSATTVCKDGTTSTATGRGACTGHGGVDKNAAKKAAAAAKAERKATTKAPAAMVTCGDGTSSKAGRGACARHGGVKVAGAAPAPNAAPNAAAMRLAASAVAPAARPAAPTATTTHASNTDPTGATALCKDGTYSHAASHRGACARHQGVSRWL